MSSYTLTDFLEGKTLSHPDMEELNEDWAADEEGNAKLQKIIRKKIQYNDDPSTPFGYRANQKGTLEHLLTWDFPENQDDKRKGAKSAEHIAKMQAGRKKTTMKEYIENI